MDAPKSKRKARFSEMEVSVLLDNVERNYGLLTSKLTDSITSKKKGKAWLDITQKVNACGVCLRAVDEIRKKSGKI